MSVLAFIACVVSGLFLLVAIGYSRTWRACWPPGAKPRGWFVCRALVTAASFLLLGSGRLELRAARVWNSSAAQALSLSCVASETSDEPARGQGVAEPWHTAISFPLTRKRTRALVSAFDAAKKSSWQPWGVGQQTLFAL